LKKKKKQTGPHKKKPGFLGKNRNTLPKTHLKQVIFSEGVGKVPPPHAHNDTGGFPTQTDAKTRGRLGVKDTNFKGRKKKGDSVLVLVV